MVDPHYPIIIIQDRCQGIYSGGPWLAVSVADQRISGLKVNRLNYVFEAGPSADDVSAMEFWSDKPEWIVARSTPDEAARKLRGNAT